MEGALPVKVNDRLCRSTDVNTEKATHEIRQDEECGNADDGETWSEARENGYSGELDVIMGFVLVICSCQRGVLGTFVSSGGRFCGYLVDTRPEFGVGGRPFGTRERKNRERRDESPRAGSRFRMFWVLQFRRPRDLLSTPVDKRL